MSEKVVRDPLQVRERLWKQVSELLKDMEAGDDHSLAERITRQIHDKRAKPETLVARIEAELDVAPRILMAERIRALAAIGRVIYLFHGMEQKAERNEPEPAGTKVARYAKSFAANATGRRAGSTRAAKLAPSPADDPFADDDEADSA